MAENKDTWADYSKLVLKELERLNENHEKMREDFDKRLNEMNLKLNEVKNISQIPFLPISFFKTVTTGSFVPSCVRSATYDL